MADTPAEYLHCLRGQPTVFQAHPHLISLKSKVCVYTAACRVSKMIDTIISLATNLTSTFKGIWQMFIIPVGVTAWAIYRDLVFNKNKVEASISSNVKPHKLENEESIFELSARHQEYMKRIESDFQDLLKQLNETESEATVLRREKWQADLQVRAWRHACRDAQQIVWALQRQGCAAGSELTQFKQIEQISS